MDDLVPTIDLGGPPRDVATAIDVAAREVGFFQIVGHDVDHDVTNAAWDAAQSFFALPMVEKMAAEIQTGEAYGYAPYRSEALAASLGAVTPPDLKETFSAGPFDAAPTGVTDPAAAFVFSQNRWPTSLPDMAPAFESYYRAMARLAERVLSLMAIGLEMPAGFFSSFVDHHTSALRALHYPDLGTISPEPGQLRAGAHSDYGTLTLLRQDDAPGGLQVRGVDERWHGVPAVSGAVVVNVGDALERWSNDRWRSTVHRVVVPPPDAGRDCTRQSLAFFHNANWDAVIECLPTCAGPSNPPRYPPTTAGAHLMEKFQKTQATSRRAGELSEEAAVD